MTGSPAGLSQSPRPPGLTTGPWLPAQIPPGPGPRGGRPRGSGCDTRAVGPPGRCPPPRESPRPGSCSDLQPLQAGAALPRVFAFRGTATSLQRGTEGRGPRSWGQRPPPDGQQAGSALAHTALGGRPVAGPASVACTGFLRPPGGCGGKGSLGGGTARARLPFRRLPAVPLARAQPLGASAHAPRDNRRNP